MRERLLDMFSFDLRLLGIFRILLGLLIIVDLINRSFDLTVFYTDEGFLPRALLLENEWFPWNFSINMATGTVLGQSIIFGVAGLFALFILVGYRTHLFLFLSYLLIASIQARNPQINHGGDTVIKVLIFYSLFLPLNARYAIDSISKKSLPLNGTVFSIGTVALIIQIISIYVFAGMQKTGTEWVDGTAVYYSMNLDMFATKFTYVINQFPALMKILTHSTIIFEKWGFILLFIPVFWKYFRFFGVLCFMSLHFGFFLFLELGNFPWAAMILWIPMFPSFVADNLEKYFNKLGTINFLTRHRDKVRDVLTNRLNWLIPEQIYHLPKLLYSLLLVLVVIAVFSWNLANTTEHKNVPFLKSVVRATVLWQSWDMFAPMPMKWDGWFVQDAQLKSGRHIDILNNKEQVSFDKPAMVHDNFRNERWQKWLLNMWIGQKKPYLRRWGAYYCECWNKKHANTPRELESFSIFFMKELTPPPGQPVPVAEKKTVWNHWCKNEFSNRFE